MKSYQTFLTGRVLLVLGAFTPAWAQNEAPPPANPPATVVENTETTVEETKVRQSTGSVFSVDADTFSITPENVTIPLNFMFNSKTVFVDEADKTVSLEQLRTGLPVTVNYDMLGDKMLATKVVSTRWMIDGGTKIGEPADTAGELREKLAFAKKKRDAQNATLRAVNAATGSEGTIMGFEQVITVRPEGSANIIQYVVNNSTHYVDTAGQPVPLQFVRTGAPVSIQYVEDSGRRIATQMVLQGAFPKAGTTPPATGAAPGTNSNAPRVSRVFGDGTVGSDISTTAIGGGTTLQNGFVNPPATTLATAFGTSSTVTRTGTTTAAGGNTQAGSATGTGTPATATQPGTTQPSAIQPSTTQPSATQPSATQPAVKQPAARPAGGSPGSSTGSGSSSGPAGSSTPSSSPAPGGR